MNIITFLEAKFLKKYPSDYLTVATNYLVIQVCLALEKIGFFEIIKQRPLSIEEIASELNANPKLLKPCVEFLWSMTDFLIKEGDKFFLNERAFPKGTVWVLEAYKTVFDNLAGLLNNEIEYERDICRDGYYLQKASDTFSKDALDKVLQIIEGEKNSVLVDLGCGSASSLIHYCCNQKERLGIGIDSNIDIVIEAKKHIEQKDLNEQIQIIKADVMSINNWKENIPKDKRVIFLASTIVHEFLRSGTKSVIHFFSKLKRNFPNSRLFLIEFDAIPLRDLKYEKEYSRKLLSAMYELWHPLTNQGMPQSEKTWKALLETAGWQIQKTSRTDHYLVIFDCT